MHDPLRTAMSQPQRVFNVVCVSVIFIFGLLISIAVPPFQSPDEFEHIIRAALLGNGDIVLRAPAGNSSGGMIDSGLAQYMASYAKIPFNPDIKLSGQDLLSPKASDGQVCKSSDLLSVWPITFQLSMPSIP